MIDGGLAGVRVLDLGRYVAAPYCSLVLADLGAEVIRVECPGGEDDRRLGLQAPNGDTYVFAGLARNKKGVTLDLRRGGAAREVLHDLVARCDVVLHNFAPAAATGLGLAYEELRGVRPDVVYAAISAYGARGPDAGRTAFDPVIQTVSGASAVTGYEGDRPIRAGVPWVDYSTGLSACVGILAALHHRQRTGEGQAVECALLATAVSYTAPIIAEATVAGRPRPRLGNQPAHIGVSNLYSCRDGQVYVVAVTTSAWRALAGIVGRQDLADDPELATPELRFEHRGRVDAAIEAWTRDRTVAEVASALTAARVPCGRLRTSDELADDPQVAANAMLPRVDLEVDGLAQVPASAAPVRLSRVPPPRPSRPPRPGEHNDEVYGGLVGYGAERIDGLRRDGVI